MYQPDNWVILKINAKNETGLEVFYKVLAGWSGGYLDGDSWRMNSGITEVIEEGDFYLFEGSSGSVYRCHKENEAVRMNTFSILNQLNEHYGDRIKQIDYDDFIKEFKN
jgi:hypothetical protein|tara:strand:+ start:517 stop:843 length:327 start_codon:yes stop_codon:yes gene_type:complete